MNHPLQEGSEAARLAALRELGILDTGPEEVFDRLVELARRIFRVPIAHLSLIDEHREWFKARFGIEATEGERAVAFCEHTVQSRSPLVVEDATTDSRFRDNPQVTAGAGVRFYAGAPLITSDGHAVGTLCIKDHQVRSFTPDELQVLGDLARVAVDELEHRRVEFQLARWRHVFETSRPGILVCDDDGAIQLANRSLAEMVQAPATDLVGGRVDELFSPDQADPLAGAIQSARDTGHHRFESRLVTRHGSELEVEVELSSLRDEGPASFAVHVFDLTERRQNDRQLDMWKQIFHRAAWGIVLTRGEGQHFETFNQTLAEMHGYELHELTGKPLSTIFSPDSATIEERIASLRVKGNHSYESVHIRKDGSTFPVQIDAVGLFAPDGRLVFRAAQVQDITARKENEERLRLANVILRTQQEASLDGILVVEGRNQVLSYNRRFTRIWEVPDRILEAGRDDLLIDSVRGTLVDPDAFEARIQYLYDHPSESSSDELRLRDGRVIDRYSAPMIGAAGETFGRVWYFRDITERIRVERAVRENEERLTSILESAMDAIITLDATRRIQLFNAAAEGVFRCTASEAIGSVIDRFLTEPLRELVEGSLTAFERAGSRKRYMWSPAGLAARRADGSEFPVEATISRAEVAGERLYTIILRDVNDRRRSEEELRRLEAENVYLKEVAGGGLDFGEVVGTSPAIRRVLEYVDQVAETEATVLVTGETGTGKELIARAVHARSRRAGKLLVKVNCAALPSGLIESEFFGHEKGAFTGAVTRKVGRFEMADGGTIFLDEIGDLPLELQSKLLRVLQEGEFERVGGTTTIRVNVRVVAATNRDLKQEVEAERFRADLYYRLDVFPIEVPPLRDRPEDIDLLAEHFVKVLGSKLGKKASTISAASLETLRGYHWPGNVRELANVIERAVILSRGPELELAGWRPGTTTPGNRVSAGNETLAEVERRHIVEVLESTRWRVSGSGGAAEILGLKPTTLESRMKKLGIERR